MSPELSAAFDGLMLAAMTAATGCVTALGIAGVFHIRRLSKAADKALALQELEIEEKMRAMRSHAAVDAACIVDEVNRAQGGRLSGPQKAELAAEKLKELEPAAAQLEGSQLTDLVRLGVARRRSQSLPGGTYIVSPSQAPPPETVHQPEERPTLPPIRRPLQPRKDPTR